MSVWRLALLYFYWEFSVDALSWGRKLSLNLWPKNPIHTVGSNEANIYFKFRSNNFTGFLPPWPVFLWLLFSLGLPTKPLTVFASKPLLFPSPLCDMECLSTQPHPITVCAQRSAGLCSFPSLTANPHHAPLFTAASRISWELVEWGEGSEHIQMRTDQLNKFLSFAIRFISTVPWLASSEENWHVQEGIWTFLPDTLPFFFLLDPQGWEEFFKAAAQAWLKIITSLSLVSSLWILSPSPIPSPFPFLSWGPSHHAPAFILLFWVISQPTARIMFPKCHFDRVTCRQVFQMFLLKLNFNPRFKSPPADSFLSPILLLPSCSLFPCLRPVCYSLCSPESRANPSLPICLPVTCSCSPLNLHSE